ncbi:MAG: hypothetical protein ACHP84_06175 [Caulobacterales bacterium]
MLIQYHLMAAFFALLLPVALFASRWVVRAQRSAVYNDVIHSLFPSDHLPQLDLIGAKYGNRPQPRTGIFLANANRDPAALLIGAALFSALCFVGFEVLLLPICQIVDAQTCPTPPASIYGPYFMSIPQSFFWVSGPAPEARFENAVAVAVAAFLGAYVAATRNLTRQALNYELNGMSFVRTIGLMIMSVIVAVIAFRSVDLGWSNVGHSISSTFGFSDQAAAATRPGLQAAVRNAPAMASAPATRSVAAPVAAGDHVAPVGVWIALAFFIGLSPEAGLAWVSRQLKLSLVKAVNISVYEKAQIVPVEIIDGIDSETAFRLEEVNIEDVQNLATSNPIMLYIETPFGLFEVFDWVLQAQLCLVVGAKTFVALKEHGIRTILDLERAVLSEYAPDAYVEAVGEILFAEASPAFLNSIKKDGAAANGPIPADVVRHAVAVTADDLHIHRLRTLWIQIRDRSWPEKHRGEWIYRASPLPGDPGFKPPEADADA